MRLFHSKLLGLAEIYSYGPISRMDQMVPVISWILVEMASGLEEPLQVEVQRAVLTVRQNLQRFQWCFFSFNA